VQLDSARAVAIFAPSRGAAPGASHGISAAPGPPAAAHEEVTMAKPVTQWVKMVSTADTGYFYVKKKNPRNITEKMTMRKYDPVARQHVEFKESKMK
jgi:large subunit ribosomal protein L33